MEAVARDVETCPEIEDEGDRRYLFVYLVFDSNISHLMGGKKEITTKAQRHQEPIEIFRVLVSLW